MQNFVTTNLGHDILSPFSPSANSDLGIKSNISSIFFPQSYFTSSEPTVIVDHRTGAKKMPHQNSFWQRSFPLSRSTDYCIYDSNAPVENEYITYLNSRGLGSKLISSDEASKFSSSYRRFQFKPQSNPINRELSDKEIFLKFCESSGVNVESFDSYTSDNISKKSLEKILEKFGDQVILRDVEGSGGVGIYVLRKGDNEKEVLEGILKDSKRGSIKYVAQKFHEDVTSPSCIGVCDERGFRILNNTEQIIDDNAYAGTYLTMRCDDPTILSMTQKIGNSLFENGYRGAFGVDYIRTPQGLLLPIELNARATAAFYPHEVLCRLRENGNSFEEISNTAYEPTHRAFPSFKEFYNSPQRKEIESKYGRDLIFSQPGLLKDAMISVLVPK
ncbi:MAG: ATP-grasp domain-containing protein [Candidatus Woesearchaeota archaeon]